MDWRGHITADPRVCHGHACIAGTRVMVSVILDNLALGYSADETLRRYPTLRAEHIAAAVAYAAELAPERDSEQAKQCRAAVAMWNDFGDRCGWFADEYSAF